MSVVLLQPPQASRPCVESPLCTIAEAARAARDLLPSTRRPSVPVCRSKYRDVTASTRLLLKQMQRGRLWYSKGDRPPKTARTSASAKSHSDLGAGSCHCCKVPAQQQHAPATARGTVSSPHGYWAGSPHHGRGRHLWAWVLQAHFPRPHSPNSPELEGSHRVPASLDSRDRCPPPPSASQGHGGGGSCGSCY